MALAVPRLLCPYLLRSAFSAMESIGAPAVRQALAAQDLRAAYSAASTALEAAPRDEELLRLQRIVAARALAFIYDISSCECT